MKIWYFSIATLLLVGLGSFIFRKELMIFGFNNVVAPTIEHTLEESYVPLEDTEESGLQATTENKDRPFSILLLGTDQRGKENGLSDSIIYTVIRPVDHKALLVSIPVIHILKLLEQKISKEHEKKPRLMQRIPTVVLR